MNCSYAMLMQVQQFGDSVLSAHLSRSDHTLEKHTHAFREPAPMKCEMNMRFKKKKLDRNETAPDVELTCAT